MCVCTCTSSRQSSSWEQRDNSNYLSQKWQRIFNFPQCCQSGTITAGWFQHRGRSEIIRLLGDALPKILGRRQTSECIPSFIVWGFGYSQMSLLTMSDDNESNLLPWWCVQGTRLCLMFFLPLTGDVTVRAVVVTMKDISVSSRLIKAKAVFNPIQSICVISVSVQHVFVCVHIRSKRANIKRGICRISMQHFAAAFT